YAQGLHSYDQYQWYPALPGLDPAFPPYALGQAVLVWNGPGSNAGARWPLPDRLEAFPELRMARSERCGTGQAFRQPGAVFAEQLSHRDGNGRIRSFHRPAARVGRALRD